jgi:hypothetical protein
MSDLEHPLKKIKLATMEHASTPHDTLDEKSLNLFSRQNAALGIDIHANLEKLSDYISCSVY